MGTAERKEREKLQRRQEIIYAAEKVFFSKGFESSTMDDVASEAELSKGTLYIYFKSKEELYQVFVIRAISKLHELFIEFSSKESDGISKVKAIGEAYIKFYYDFPNYYKALMYDESKTLPKFYSEIEVDDIMKIKMETNTIFINTIKEGIEDGSIRADLDPVKTSLILWGEVLGVLQLVTLKGDILCEAMQCSSEELISYFFEFTYKALKP
ncbi:MAG: TetR/AcrR family transcriptional regulator [Ignavibacteriae bacterium]|nr:TetR/AcrR family transcriptional regulator [Ignavibacteriota bacterium]MCB9206486.1 TetR/AcrR family transcriptional regulator [Ignavibacteriales bacterium]MCB9219409.1 TetR/AcrR family transcriptional regulator [Ignavibacteriales bacterium]MCB9259917.1 TetR/AcrR family transcriptional regulator [Ignavibacteriales bacterium]